MSLEVGQTLGHFRCQDEHCCDRDNCKNQMIRRSSLKKRAITILHRSKEINTADWVEFFGIEEEFASFVLSDKEEKVTQND